MISNPAAISRGRSLTPPSFKQNLRLPSMNHLRAQDLYYHHPAIYSDPTYYRTYGDPYLMQRLPPPTFLPSTSSPPSSSSRPYRNMYSSSGIDYYTTNMSTLQNHRRSRSRRRYEKDKIYIDLYVAIHLFFSSHHHYLSFRLFYNCCSSHTLNFFSLSKQTVLGEYYGIYIKVGFFRSAIYVK